VYDHGRGWAGQLSQQKISMGMDMDMDMKTRSADAKDIHAVQCNRQLLLAVSAWPPIRIMLAP
jgi:hypothetical protein